MKLTTIWTLRPMSLKERINRTGELVIREVARRLPRRLAYWVVIDSTVRNTKPDDIVPEVTVFDVLDRMCKRNRWAA